MSEKDPKSLRSYRWYGPDDLRSFGHRSRAASMGCTQADYAGKPVIAIINTWGDINPCHSHLRERAEDVKRGVWQAGGFPVEMPAFTLGETFQKPTTMMYRNLLAMETEELLRSYPADGCVLMGGCDKTTPALMMGAISMNLPAIYVPAGPMLRGNWHGQILGSGSDVSKYWAERRAGNIDLRAWTELCWNLYDHGHRVDHDEFDRGVGLHSSRRDLDPRSRCQSPKNGKPFRPSRSGNGLGRFEATRHFARSFLQQCDRRSVWARRLDERGDSPACRGRASGNKNHARALRPIFKKDAHAREYSSERQIPHGRFLLRRWSTSSA